MDNKHRKLFVFKHSEGCKFMPKMIKIRLAAGLHPDPLVYPPENDHPFQY